MVDYLKNKAHNAYMAAATPLMGVSILLLQLYKVLKDSKFLEKGLLTPQEFVTAGD